MKIGNSLGFFAVLHLYADAIIAANETAKLP